MDWKLIKKDPANQPLEGTYRDWKELIAKECYFQCVYCSIGENQFGGITNYHIDHFKPKSRFPELENDILNLFYSCPICNRFKSNDWPDDSDRDTISYPDPSRLDFSELFAINENFSLIGKFASSRYITIRLFLNRPQLIMERREFLNYKKVTRLIQLIDKLLDTLSEVDLPMQFFIEREVSRVKSRLLELNEIRKSIRPYEITDIRK